nr:MAG TPA: FeoB-associated Cys-rich membrane protein [Caudoviricetes sp.]
MKSNSGSTKQNIIFIVLILLASSFYIWSLNNSKKSIETQGNYKIDCKVTTVASEIAICMEAFKK